MPDLLEGPLALEIDYMVSLPHSVLATASLLCATAQFEGLGDWLQEAKTQMTPDLYQELCLIITFPGQYQRFTAELLSCLPPEAPSWSFDQLVAHLSKIPAVRYQLLTLRALARGGSPSPSTTALLTLLDDPATWAAYLHRAGSEVAPEIVAALVRNGDELKERVIQTIVRFWNEIYSQEFQATRPAMERSVAHNLSRVSPPGFADLFLAVTGRRIPEGLAALLPGIRRVVFCPSCYVGPYVAYSHLADQLILYYNCRATPTSTAAGQELGLYPPLKALADETRLQILALLRGRELYAQEIVDKLDISQPAVSRHLNLMAASGILKIRREGNAKYYAIDGETLTCMADTLRRFV